jgi:hypothetical protein
VHSAPRAQPPDITVKTKSEATSAKPFLAIVTIVPPDRPQHRARHRRKTYPKHARFYVCWSSTLRMVVRRESPRFPDAYARHYLLLRVELWFA